MQIICSKEFCDAVTMSIRADNALSAVIDVEQNADTKMLLETKRGQAVKTLLGCLQTRAYADMVANKEPQFKQATMVEKAGIRTAIDMANPRTWPIRDTLIVSDGANAFMFREVYLDPDTRERVTVIDPVWVIFTDGTTQAQVNAMSDEELWARVCDNTAMRTFDADEAARMQTPGTVIRHTMRTRQGMVGGVVFHHDYLPNGKVAPYGSWSTHT